VDVGAAHKLLTELRGLVDEGRSLLVSTSEVGDVLAVADRVLIIGDGRVTAELVRGRDDFSENAILRALNQNVKGDSMLSDAEGTN
jgi:ABC-type sugar transport system ATPase subunit